MMSLEDDNRTKLSLVRNYSAGMADTDLERLNTAFGEEAMLEAMSTIEWRCVALNLSMGSGLNRTLDFYNEYIDLTIELERKPGWYVNNVIVPCALLVFISWASFFIARAAVPARVSIGIVCYLTLQNLGSSVRNGLPKLSYSVRLLDLLMCSQ